jgi:hypothetical protein
MDSAWDGYQGMYGGSLPQQNYYSNPNSYHPHSAFHQHDPQPGVSAGYPSGPTMGANFTSQMAPSQEYAEFNQWPYNRTTFPQLADSDRIGGPHFSSSVGVHMANIV